MTPEAPRPFTIQVPEAVLADLRERLHRVHWPDEVPGAGWQYGTALSSMQELAAYGHDRYDWRTQEPQLNRFQQYRDLREGTCDKTSFQGFVGCQVCRL